MEEKSLKQKREEMVTKTFWASFQTIFIFGAPAFFGAFVGLKLDDFYGTGRKITIFILLMAFAFSWLIIILKYKKLNKEFNALK